MAAVGKPAILLTDSRSQPMVAPLSDEFTILSLQDEAQVEREAGNVQAIMFLGHNQVPAALIDRFPNLRILVSPSAGVEGVDFAATRRRGVPVTSGGDTHSGDAAGHAVALAVAARYGLVESDRHVRSGAWLKGWPPIRRSMSVDRVGIVGLGPIGRAVGERIAPMCGEVAWHGPNPKTSPWRRFDNLLSLAEWSDILILCARSDKTTAGLIDARVLDAIGAGGLFVNVARGFMVDEDALIDALKSGRLGGAALDVFAQEPADPKRWEDVPRVLMSPHIGGITNEAARALTELVLFNLRTLRTGEPLRNVVQARGGSA